MEVVLVLNCPFCEVLESLNPQIDQFENHPPTMSSAYYSPLVSDDLIWEVARMFLSPNIPGEGSAVRWGGEGGGLGGQDWMGWGWEG